MESKYDLEERTAKFGEEVIKFCKNVRETTVSKPIISQLIRSATSIGANYMEANGASSKSDFRNKIFICKKESQETKHWLRMLAVFDPNLKESIKLLWNEAQALTMIFQKILNSLNKKI
jgi:four helix bundle protein